MAAQVKYYALNKEMDYRRGYLSHIECSGQGIHIKKGGDVYSVFISRVFDSKESQNLWHRMHLEVSEDEGVLWRLSFYAADEDYLMQDGHPVSVLEIIRSEIPVEQKKQAFAPCLKLEVTNTADILLHQVCGRYLWFMLEVYGQPETQASFSNIMVYFPKQTWLRYLPEVYDRTNVGDTFLERYLAIFQSLYDDLNRSIDEIPISLEPQTGNRQVLERLASELGIGDIRLWSEPQLRYLVSHAPEMYRKRGTKQGLSDFIQLYTGEKPFIVEQHKIEKFTDNEIQYTLLRDLYGSDPYMLTILIGEQFVPTAKEFSDLQKIIEHIKPAWMAFKLITLRPYILLDNYTYLGVNSVLSEYRPTKLDDSAMLSFATVGEVRL